LDSRIVVRADSFQTSIYLSDQLASLKLEEAHMTDRICENCRDWVFYFKCWMEQRDPLAVAFVSDCLGFKLRGDVSERRLG